MGKSTKEEIEDCLNRPNPFNIFKKNRIKRVEINCCGCNKIIGYSDYFMTSSITCKRCEHKIGQINTGEKE